MTSTIFLRNDITQKYVIDRKIKGEIKLSKENNGWHDVSRYDMEFYRSYNAYPIPKRIEAENIPIP